MLGKLIDEHGSNVWLVNTGWTGGAFGVGKRMKLSHTRAMVHSICSTAISHNAKLETRSDLRPAGPDADRERAGRRAQAAQHVARQGRVRRAGAKARGDVPRELREVREVRSGRGEERGTESERGADDEGRGAGNEKTRGRRDFVSAAFFLSLPLSPLPSPL